MFLVRLKYSAFKFEYQNKFSPKNLFVFKKIYNLFCTIEATSLTAFHKFSFSWWMKRQNTDTEVVIFSTVEGNFRAIGALN